MSSTELFVATVLIVIVAVASRPIELRAWRSGRISDRTLAALLLGRFPVLGAVFAFLIGGSLPVIGLVVIAAAIPAVVGYGFVLGMVQEQAAERKRAPQPSAIDHH